MFKEDAAPQSFVMALVLDPRTELSGSIGTNLRISVFVL